MPNYKIVHSGMDFPVGTVVSESAFPNGGIAGLLHCGAIIKTNTSTTVELPKELTKLSASDAEAAAELRATLVAKCGELAELQTAHDVLREEHEKLAAENTQLKADYETAMQLAEQRHALDHTVTDKTI